MTAELSFHVRGWAAWSPGRQSESAWREWAGLPTESEDIRPTSLPVALRRRVSPLGQAALRCAWGLPDASSARMVFASRHGEFSRTMSILDSMIAGEDVSPADFTLSVHHALAGVLAIVQGNRCGHTAVAGGPDTFGFGLMEAVASLAERPTEPVLFIYYDEPLPPPYADFERNADEPLALALSLVSVGNGERFSISVAPSEGVRSTASALEFVRFLLTDAREVISRGERSQWEWRRYAAAA